ncbi:hypothetical protein MMC12_008138 [Toensbergia leucococca]|nr:hypothetical protein [Toensbergia leucococca]
MIPASSLNGAGPGLSYLSQITRKKQINSANPRPPLAPPISTAEDVNLDTLSPIPTAALTTYSLNGVKVKRDRGNDPSTKRTNKAAKSNTDNGQSDVVWTAQCQATHGLAVPQSTNLVSPSKIGQKRGSKKPHVQPHTPWGPLIGLNTCRSPSHRRAQPHSTTRSSIQFLSVPTDRTRLLHFASEECYLLIGLEDSRTCMFGRVVREGLFGGSDDFVADEMTDAKLQSFVYGMRDQTSNCGHLST